MKGQQSSGDAEGAADTLGIEMEDPEFVEHVSRTPVLLKRMFPSLAPADAQDITSSTVLNFLQRMSKDPESFASIEQPKAYFTRAAINATYHWFAATARRERPAEEDYEINNLPLSDDRAAAAFESAATALDMRRILSRLAAKEDATLFQILTYMLNETYVTGRAPSNRQVAEACGLSHTGVAKALVRLQPYFQEIRAEAGGA